VVLARQNSPKSSRKCCGVLSPSQLVKAASRRRAAPGNQCWGRRKAGGCDSARRFQSAVVASVPQVWSPASHQRGVFAKGKARGLGLRCVLQMQRYSFGRCISALCALTLRSSGAPTACHQAWAVGVRTFSTAQAWRQAVVARLARTLGVTRHAIHCIPAVGVVDNVAHSWHHAQHEGGAATEGTSSVR
jgi:hypothetical protein